VTGIDHTLGYLRETMSNYAEDELGRQIYRKLAHNHYENEEEFVRTLEDEEAEYLDSLLKEELEYARQAQDEKRLRKLNEVYEQLTP
jgi:predicted TPR repeat methyltransferase